MTIMVNTHPNTNRLTDTATSMAPSMAGAMPTPMSQALPERLAIPTLPIQRQMLEMVAEFEKYARVADFERIFGVNGREQWRSFRIQSRSNIAQFSDGLALAEADALAEGITQWHRERWNC